jgi:hypothetical protein
VLYLIIKAPGGRGGCEREKRQREDEDKHKSE